MKAVLGKEAARVACVASTADAECIVSCVKIGDDKIVACDGFLVAEHPIEVIEGAEGDNEILVKAADVKKAMRCSYKEITITADEQTKSASIENLEQQVSVHSELFQGRPYPDVASLQPQGDRKAYVAFSPGLLAKLLKVTRGSSCIKFRIREATSAVEFVAGRTHGLIMPMFMEEEDESWG